VHVLLKKENYLLQLTRTYSATTKIIVKLKLSSSHTNKTTTKNTNNTTYISTLKCLIVLKETEKSTHHNIEISHRH